MTESLQVLLGVYLAIAIILLLVGVMFFVDHYQEHPRGDRDSFYARRNRAGARFILAAAVWPLAVVLVAVKGALYWVPRIWKEAWS